MRIKKLKVLNFRGYSAKEVEFNDVNFISGKNGSGKTSIKEAILFSLYGRDYTGTNRGTSTLIKGGTGFTTAVVTSEEHSIRRDKSWGETKVYLLDGSQKMEDSEVAQRDLEYILPDADVFQAVFDVGWFMTLSDDKKRNMIVQYSEPVDRVKLFSEHYDPELLKRWKIKFKDYAKERTDFMKLRRIYEKDIEFAERGMRENRSAKTDYLKQAKIVEDFGVIMLEKCDKCNQPIRTEKYENYIKEKTRLDVLKEMVMKEQEQKNKTEEELIDIRQKRDDLNVLIEAFEPGNLPTKELDIQLQNSVQYLQKLVPGLTIKTTRQNTLLQDVDCFLPVLNGTPYERLSTGEQMRVNIAFSMLIDYLTEQEVGMFFIDNCESLSKGAKIPEPDGQVFYSSVTEDDLKTN